MADVLCRIDFEPSKKVGRPTLITLKMKEACAKAPKKAYIPPDDIRCDGLNHLPDMLDRSGKKYANWQAVNPTQIICQKCNLNSCLSAVRKCFIELHEIMFISYLYEVIHLVNFITLFFHLK